MERLLAKYRVAAHVVHFPLHPDTPQGGLTLEQLLAGRNFDLPAANARMSRLMREEGLPYGERTKTFNSRLAQELATWAETQTSGAAIHNALFKAYFVDGLNIASAENLVAVAKQVGLDPSRARQVLKNRDFKPAVDADWRLSQELGITAVTTFVLGNRALVGAQPYEALENLLVAAGATARTD